MSIRTRQLSWSARLKPISSKSITLWRDAHVGFGAIFPELALAVDTHARANLYPVKHTFTSAAATS
jgi:hypothetical protein